MNELKEKIQDDLGVPCPIATFHSTGNAIIHKNSPEEKLNIVDNSKLYFVIRDYFRGSVMKNESVVNKLIMFFATYFDAPYEGDDLNGFFNNIAKANYSTMRSDLEDFKREVIDTRTKKSVTIQNEILRSHQEVEIANFLYLNNIEYEYEPIYQYNIQYSHKPYTPDFVIYQNGKIAYIEHFGITENGKNDRYSQDELEQYKKAINDKIKLHKQHDTTLIYTFSVYNDGKPLTEHLQEALEVKGFELKPRSNKEVMELLVAGEENRYVRKLINLICRFISNFKVNGYNAEEFNRMYHSTQNVRSRLFLEICHDCYLEYDRWLKENKAVDFEDMINESARLLREVKEMKQKLSFKYIIVDEYQDISRQRFDLTKALSEVTDAIVVPMGEYQRRIYDFIEKKYMDEMIGEGEPDLSSKFKIALAHARMIRLMQAASDPVMLRTPLNEFLEDDECPLEAYQAIHDADVLKAIIEYEAIEIPSKFLAVEKIVRQIIEDGGKVVIWATFIHTIHSIKEYLESKGIQCQELYGAIPVEKEGTIDDGEEQILTREKIVRAFQDDNCPFKVIIANPFAVAESISLHKACHNAIYLERSFNAAHFVQSKDRIHRYGLKEGTKTNYYYILSEDSIDETIDARLAEKEHRMNEIMLFQKYRLVFRATHV